MASLQLQTSAYLPAAADLPAEPFCQVNLQTVMIVELCRHTFASLG